MKKRKNTKKQLKELTENCACANECTGLLQKADPDPDDVALYHKLYNGGREKKD